MEKFIRFIALAVIINIIQFSILALLVFKSNMDFFRGIRELYVSSAMNTQTHQYLATLFVSKDEIDRIMNSNKVPLIQTGKTNTNEIKNTEDTSNGNNTGNIVTGNDKIEVFNILDGTCSGKLMIVNDPSRISVGISKDLANGIVGSSNRRRVKVGDPLRNIISSEGAMGGINAGGIEKRGIPTGIVIKDGKTLYNDNAEMNYIVGFDKSNILIIGKYNKNEINSLMLRDAVSFFPFLILNGQPQLTDDNYDRSLAPRTLIGQRKTGEVLLLVIDGRSFSSIGATMKQAQDIMLKNGAYNAANLDGGGSTGMYLNGQSLTTSESDRFIPTAFIVK